MCHPFDGEVWKHFDRMHLEFSQDPRNVRLGLCSDGFSLFGQFGKTYSCWLIILTLYNLPPGICKKREFMFLTVQIPSPSNPRHKIDVFNCLNSMFLTFLIPLGMCKKREFIDVSMRQNFLMKVALMRTINDFLAYGMLSGWTTAGRLGSPI